MNVIKSGYFLLLMSHIDFIIRPAQEEESLFLPHSSKGKYTHAKQIGTNAKDQFFIWAIEGRTVEGQGGDFLFPQVKREGLQRYYSES